MSQASVLIVDKDPELLRRLRETVRSRMPNVKVDTARSGAEAVQRFTANAYHVLVTDVRMRGPDGLSLLAEVRTRWPDIHAVVIMGHDEYESAIHSLTGETLDFIQKPVDPNYFVASLRWAIQIGEFRRRTKESQAALEPRTVEARQCFEVRERELHVTARIIYSPLKWLLGRTPQMQEVVRQIIRVADCPFTILVQGETGTGKELVAHAIHRLSSRFREPFVAIDCGAIPDTLIESELFGHEKGAFTGADQRKEGRFQIAGRGSLFLDEIANLSLSTQSKLLRVLQEREVHMLGGNLPMGVNARMIAASNVALQQYVQIGHFRPDLYYRLAEFTINLPPLRERDDVLDLANAFLAEARTELGCSAQQISEAAAGVLLHYSWPGNARELRNVIRRAVIFASDVIGPSDLSFLDVDASPACSQRSQPVLLGSSLKEIAKAAAADAEREAIRQRLRAARGNRSKAARELQVDHKTLYLKMKQYGIYTSEFKKSV